MESEDLKGYRGDAKALLIREKARVWGDVIVTTDQGDFRGLILPRSETADDQHIVLKQPNGYNIGLRVDSIEKITEVGYRKAHYKIPEKTYPSDPSKPNVTLLGTGGTIASRLDYRSGAVIPAFSPGELYGAVPELVDVCNLNTIKLYGEFSENIGPEHWMGIARYIKEEIEAGADGIVIGQNRYHASYRRGVDFHGSKSAGSHRYGGQPTLFRPPFFGCSAEPDQRLPGGRL